MSSCNITKSLALISASFLFSLYTATAWGQVATDVDCVRCVDEVDLNVLSVGIGKLKDGAVIGRKIGNGAVSKAKIAAAAVGTGKIQDNAVATCKIANGAVTAAKLALGAVVADDIFLRTVLVSPVGTPTQNGQELLDAINDIGTANSLCSATPFDVSTACLIKLEPGLYDVGSNQLRIRSFINMEGAGESMTIIRGRGIRQLVQALGNAELRSLRIEHEGQIDLAFAIVTGSSGSARITNVTAVATNANGAALTISMNGAPFLTNVTSISSTLSSSGASRAFVVGGTPTLVNAKGTATTPGGTSGIAVNLAGAFGPLVARNSTFIGEFAAISNDSIANLIATQLDGGLTGSGIYNCVGAYDGAFAALDASCL